MNVRDFIRFLGKVRNTKDGCWKWTGARRFWKKEPWDGGYGAFKVDGRVVRAHRWAYEFLKGKVGAGIVLLHRCDRRWCVNPWHLTPGTQRENVSDMIRKGRARWQRMASC